MILSELLTEWRSTYGYGAVRKASRNNADDSGNKNGAKNLSNNSSVQNVFAKYGNKTIQNNQLPSSANYLNYFAFKAKESDNGCIIEKSYMEPEIKTKFMYAVKTDDEGKVTEFKCNSKAAFPTAITEEVSNFDLLCALGETNNSRIDNPAEKSKIFTPKLRESRNMKLISQNDSENGLQYNVYEKGDTVVLAINGLNDSRDVRTGALITMLNHKAVKITGIGFFAKDDQIKEMDAVYKKYRKMCTEQGKNLVVTGYSIGGAITRFVAMNNEGDTQTRFVSFNALGTGNVAGRTIQNYCIGEDNISSGTWLFPVTEGTKIFNSKNSDKHSLEAFLNT